MYMSPCARYRVACRCRFPLNPLPVRREEGPKKYNRVHGIGLDGVTIQGPREAGGLSLLEANIVKDACFGHCTPGMSDARYHYHMSPSCAWSDDNVHGEHYTEARPVLGHWVICKGPPRLE